MDNAAYLVPAGHGEAEYVEKRSRFIGQVWPAASEEEARALVAQVKSEHHDARHNCWCCSIRAGMGQGPVLRYADDGEPQGTAGQPMLEVFRRAGVENVLCVVTRYFGGILLGTGGLTRAYSHTAKLALESAGLAEMRPMSVMEIICPYGLYEKIKNEIEAFGGLVDDVVYAADVTVAAAFDTARVKDFAERLTEMTSGSVRGTVTGHRTMAVPL